MKRKLRIPALAVLAIAVLLSFGLGASALMPPLNVPADYDTITAALAHAVAGSTILVAAGYDSEDDDEKFPITVTLDNITIIGASGAIIRVPASHAGVVFKGVTGGKLEGFLITSEKDADPEKLPPNTELGDIGVVVKESTNVTVKENTIYNLLEGIRLINASYNTIENNTIYDIGEDTDTETPVVRNGIGIFLEVSTGNTLTGNEVYDSGMGLFVFESTYNDVIGDSYHDNTFMGADLNDSSRNGLDGLSVKDNGTWGIYLMFSAENVVENCEISGNDMGGIELAASSLNTISSNYIHDNGSSNQDNFQLVLAEGDKALFTSPIFDAERPLGEVDKIRAKKHKLEWKVNLFEGWLVDLDEELIEIEEKILIADGMTRVLQTPSWTYVSYKIGEAIAEKHCIQTDSNTIADLDYCCHRPGFTTWLTDLTKNFSLEGAGGNFDQQIDSLYVAKTTATGDGIIAPQPAIFTSTGWKLVTEDYTETTKYPYTVMKEFVLVAKSKGYIHPLPGVLDDIMTGDETDFPLDANTESLTKMALLETLRCAIDVEVDEIIREVEALGTPVAIDEYTQQEILGKLWTIKQQLVVIGSTFTQFMDPDTEGEGFAALDIPLEAAKEEADGDTPNRTTVQDHLTKDTTGARDKLQTIITAKELLLEYKGALWWINLKLTEINEELPPEALFNGTIIGKKEKVVGDDGDITVAEITGVKDALVAALNKDDPVNTDALDILREYENNPSAMFDTGDIVPENFAAVCSTQNVIESNVFTTQVITNGYNVAIGLECANNTVVNNLITNEDIINGRAGFFGTMDRGIIMLSSHNTVAYNAIEYVDIGIVRGGYWDRPDVQQEFIFKKLAKAQVDASDRAISIIAVMEIVSSTIDVSIGSATEQREVKWNRIALNLFEHLGYGIKIVDAESNQIDENMFVENTDGGIYFGPNVGPHIIIVHNDFVGGLSVVNAGTTSRDASNNYALDSPVSGPVEAPAASSAFCSANFGTSDKFEDLEIERFFNSDYPTLPPMAQSSNLRRLVVAGVVFTLPDEKPRTCADVFEEAPSPEGECCQFYAGWNLTSLPVEPVNPDPEVVYDEVAGTLYLYEYVPATGTWHTVENGLLTEVSSMGAYYLWLAEDTLVCVTGTALDSPQSLALGDAGWYTFGVPYEVDWDDGGQIMVTRGATTYDLADAVAAGWIWNLVYEYDAVAQDWITTSVATGTTLQVCKGYWFYTYVDDLLFGIWETPQQGPPGPPPVPSTKKSLNTLKAPGTPPMPGEPVSFQADGLEFTNYPNPVRDVHTTTFAVKGAMAVFVEAIKVQIFDLSGRMVYEREEAGKSFDWHTDNDYGELLANGVYLYKLYALVEGKWVVSDVRKLAILR